MYVYIRWLEVEKMIEGAIETDNTSIVMPIVSDGHQDYIVRTKRGQSIGIQERLGQCRSDWQSSLPWSMSSLRKLLTLFWAVGMYTSTWKVWIDANIIFFLLQIWEAGICEWTKWLLFGDRFISRTVPVFYPPWDAYHGCRIEVVNARVSLLSPVH